MNFTKMHGCGNDFILINNYQKKLEIGDKPNLIKAICDRRLGIGADGLIIMAKSEVESCDVKMEFYNADGTRAEMCGNGARCLARFAHEELGLNDAVLDTLAGKVRTSHLKNNIYLVEINLPTVKKYNICVLNGSVKGDYIELGKPGVPHFVYNYDFHSSKEIDLYRLAKSIRHDPIFNKGVNVNFYHKKENIFYVKTYERGVEDFTLACGTGVSSVGISYLKNIKEGEYVIRNKVEGGELMVEISKKEGKVNHIILSGETQVAFKGVYNFNY